MKKEQNLENSTEQALTMPVVMPRFLPEFIEWIYMNSYEQVDFGQWKRWYTDEALDAYENEANPDFEIDRSAYTTEQLYEKCKMDFSYWDFLNGA